MTSDSGRKETTTDLSTSTVTDDDKLSTNLRHDDDVGDVRWTDVSVEDDDDDDNERKVMAGRDDAQKGKKWRGGQPLHYVILPPTIHVALSRSARSREPPPRPPSRQFSYSS